MSGGGNDVGTYVVVHSSGLWNVYRCSDTGRRGDIRGIVDLVSRSYALVFR